MTTLAKAFMSLVFDTVQCAVSGKDHGLGGHMVWTGSLESAIQLAVQQKKPVMVIIHKSGCKACKTLKPKFASSADIGAYSKHLVMVNLLDGEAPLNASYAPDGFYVPRILFLSPRGYVDTDIVNEDGSEQHKYFYSRPEHIANSMRRVINKYLEVKLEET